jgi:hypothetical protein
MLININKFSIPFTRLEDKEVHYFSQIFPFQRIDNENVLKYLGFHLKPNDYGKKDQYWLIAKVEKNLSIWCIMVVKYVLEDIPIF